MEIFLIIMLFLFPYDIIHLCIFMRNFMMQYISKTTKFKIFILDLYVKILKLFWLKIFIPFTLNFSEEKKHELRNKLNDYRIAK